jgi:PAS domain S-box-containing protein
MSEYNTPGATQAGSPLHILLVEDSDVHVTLIREALETCDRQITLEVCRNLAEARVYLEGSCPDLAIVDLLLPDGRGVELLPASREEGRFPIVILTSHGNERQAVEAMKAGAMDYLVKSAATLTELPHIIERSLQLWDHISRRRQAEQSLRESEERFRSFFTTAAAGMVILSPDGGIIQVNPAFCGFIGYREDELRQLTITEITHPDDRGMTSGSYEQIFSGQKRAVHYEKRYLRKDGQVIWGHASVACIMGADQQPLHCICLVQDISERKKAEEDLRQANRELDAFVYTVSHDLRSPLTPIIGFADYLRTEYHDSLDAEAQKMLVEIGKQGHLMLELLEDLLSLARVGHLERPAEPVDLRDVVLEVVGGFWNRLEQCGMTVTLDDLPSLRAPKSLLVQIFDNLIGNALRYAGQQGGTVEVGGERIGNRVRLYVRDHGPGIPAAEQETVFDLFYRGSTGKVVEGTGVGLATVLKIARLYGGNAWVEETVGGGCTFRVEMLDEEGTVDG